ncbi:MAG: zinc ribbon domain-containing protein [Methanomicrobiaceae archaeon]|nr:zinc ribbon domain-containing protein [Methanomicrobiaceae archaeon]
MNGPITLETDVYTAMGSLWSGNRTAISPLESGTAPPNASQRDQLLQLGLINAQGQPTLRLNNILSVLGEAGISADILCITGEVEAQYTSYFSSDASVAVLVKTEGASTTIFPAPSPEDVTGDLCAKMGPAEAPSTGFRAEISPDEALVLAALIDQQRQSVTAMIASQSADSIPPVVFYAYEVEQILHNYLKNLPSWPVLALVSAITEPHALTGDAIGQVLSRLVTEGFLTRSGQGYIFQNALHAYVGTLLRPEYYLMVTVRTLRSGARTAEEECFSIRFTNGIFSAIHRSEDADTLYLRSRTQDSVMETLRQILINPRSFAMSLGIPSGSGSLASPPTPATKPSSGEFCPACGVPAQPGAKFCRSCGAALSPSAGPPACPRCGQEVREGARFCNTCGQKIA